MRTQRFLALMMCVAMAMAALLTGCAQSGTAVTTASAVSSAAESASAAPESTVNGEPIKLVLAKPIWGNKTADDPSIKLIQQKILEKLNIDLAVVGEQNPADQEQKAKLMLTSGEQLDMFNMGDWTKYTKNDTIIPINDLLDKYGMDILANALPETIKNHTDKDGKIWAVPYEQYPVSIALLIRQDWLDTLGLKVPTTIEEYENVMQQFKDKKNDQGLVPLWEGVLESSFAGSFIMTGDQRFLDTDGKIKPPFLSPEYKDYLAKMADWYKKGYIHKEAATMQYQQAMDTFNGGQAGVMMNWLNSIVMNEASLIAKVPEGKISGVPTLKGPKYSGMFTSDLPYGWGTVITKGSKNPEACMQFMNYTVGTDEGYKLTIFGVEGTQWQWGDEANGVIKPMLDSKAELYLDGAGGETSLTTGFLMKFFSKYVTSQRDKEFMLWLNDKSINNTSFPVDFGVIYDTTTMVGKDNIASLETLINEAKWKVIMGDKPVSYWDEVITDWRSKGGDQWIEDYTTQYNAAKGIK